jgi:AsmA protein
MQQLAMNVPVTADKQVLQKLALSLDLQGTKDSVALENLKITLDDTNINGYLTFAEPLMVEKSVCSLA